MKDLRYWRESCLLSLLSSFFFFSLSELRFLSSGQLFLPPSKPPDSCPACDLPMLPWGGRKKSPPKHKAASLLQLSQQKEYYASLIKPDSFEEVKLEVIQCAIRRKELAVLLPAATAELIAKAKSILAEEFQTSKDFIPATIQHSAASEDEVEIANNQEEESLHLLIPSSRRNLLR